MRGLVALGISIVAGVAGCGFQAPDADPNEMVTSVGFLATTSLQDEASGTINIAVALNAPTSDLVSVRYAFSGGTATNGLDYTGSDNTLTIPPGATDAKIPVTILPDGLEEEAETIEITLSDPTNAQLGTSEHTITISRDILPRVNFTTPSSMTDEGTSPTLAMSLDMPSTMTITVDYVITGTASAGTDYTLTQGTVTFPAGTTEKELPLQVTDDALDEFDENMLVTLTSSSNVVVGTAASHDHMILDNDAPPTVAFLNATQSKAENGGTIDLVVKLSAPSGKPIMVDLAAGPAPAIAATSGVDYTYPTAMTLMFPAGTTQQTLTVTLNDDTIDEFDEAFTTNLAVQATYNVTLGTTTSNVATITDNDPLPTVDFTTASDTVNEGDTGTTPYVYTVTLSAASAKPITVPITLGGDASAPSDYTITGNPISIAPGATSGSITVNVVGNKTKETSSGGTKTVTMTIPQNGLTNVARGNQNSRTLTIRDDD